MKKFIATLILAAVPSAFAACGGDSNDGPSSCTKSGKAICKRACECSGGTDCALVTVISSTTGASAMTRVSWDDLGECETFHALACLGTNTSTTVDYDACEAEIPNVMCSGTGTGRGVTPPNSCS